MITIIPPFRAQRITEALEGQQVPTQIMSEWMEQVSSLLGDLQTAQGTGSPEGVLEAGENKYYRDEATNFLYIKTTATGNTGWVQV